MLPMLEDQDQDPIKIWKKGSVNIYPHISWDKCLNNKELKKVGKYIVDKLVEKGYNAYIWSVSSYCREVNGLWNVVISVVLKDESSNKTTKYMYMIRRDDKLNKTFGCPFINLEYIKDLNELPFSLPLIKDQYKKSILRNQCLITSETKQLEYYKNKIDTIDATIRSDDIVYFQSKIQLLMNRIETLTATNEILIKRVNNDIGNINKLYSDFEEILTKVMGLGVKINQFDAV